MAGIVDYIKWRGDLEFSISPFNEVDNLILTKFAYLDMSGILDEPLTIEEAAKRFYLYKKDAQMGVLLTDTTFELMDLMAKSRRFGQLLIKDYVDLIDEGKNMQFAVMTIEIKENVSYVAFRGTDDTLVGWKEDFMMSFVEVIPAQAEALEYLKQVSIKFPKDMFYVGGHSKGGNLAVYSAATCHRDISDRLIKIYNNDGPGLRKEVIESEKYERVANRVVTLLPQSSMIGMLLVHEGNYGVIKSTEFGPYQHDGFSWEVIGTGFVYLSERDDDSFVIDLTVRNVLSNMSLEQRENFTNVLFDILMSNDKKTLTDIEKEGIKGLIEMNRQFISLDKVTKDAIKETLGMFFIEGVRSFRDVKNADQWREKLHERRIRLFNRNSDNY